MHDNNDCKEACVESKLSDLDTNKMSTSHPKEINIGTDMPFTLDIFDELVNIHQKKIIDSCLALDALDSLMECELYFGSTIINQTTITQYFEISNVKYLHN